MYDEDEIQCRLEPTVEWDKAKKAAAKLELMLSDEIAYLTQGNKLRNVYSPIAWVRLCRTMATLTAGMACNRLAAEGKTNQEIREATGVSVGSIAAFKAWNTMYTRDVEKLLAVKGKTEVQRERDLDFLSSIGVCL